MAVLVVVEVVLLFVATVAPPFPLSLLPASATNDDVFGLRLAEVYLPSNHLSE